MKRILAAIFLVTYLAFSSGVVINYHFCMNELASTALFESDSEVCGRCGMHDENNGCCHDEVVVMKAKDDQTASVAFNVSIKAPEQVLPVLPSIEMLQKFNPAGHSYAVSPGPPLLTEREIYLQNRVFRI